MKFKYQGIAKKMTEKPRSQNKAHQRVRALLTKVMLSEDLAISYVLLS